MTRMRTLWGVVAVSWLAVVSPSLAGSVQPPSPDIVRCDFDGDGTHDLAFAGPGTDRVNVLEKARSRSVGYLPNGGNRWEARHCIRIVPSDGTSLPGTTGLYGLLAEWAPWVRIQQISATGQEAEVTTLVARAGGWRRPVGTADVDGDGAQDLVFEFGTDRRERLGEVLIVFGDRCPFKGNLNTQVILGLGGYRCPRILFPIADGYWDYAGKGDIDADGDEDLFHVSEDGAYLRIDRFENLKATGRSYLSLADGLWSLRAIGDVTGDGKADVVLDSPTTSKIVQLEDGVATDVLFAPNGGGTLDPRLLADTNGDGAKDILFVGEDHTRIDLMSNQGLEVVDWGFIGNQQRTPAMTGDFDGDGREDLIGTRPENPARIILLDGVTARPPRPLPIGTSAPFELVTE